MKKILFLFTVSVLLFSCAPKLYDVNVQKSNATKEEQVFIQRFEYAVKNHKAKRFMKYLDEGYKKEQFEKFYNGNLKNFLQDFFCGYGADKKFYCLSFYDIENIEVSKIEPYEQNQKKVTFKISGKGKVFFVELFLNKQQKLGFIGAYG